MGMICTFLLVGGPALAKPGEDGNEHLLKMGRDRNKLWIRATTRDLSLVSGDNYDPVSEIGASGGETSSVRHFWAGILHDVDQFPDTLYAGCNLYMVSNAARGATQRCRVRQQAADQPEAAPAARPQTPPSVTQEVREAVRRVRVPGSGLVIQPADAAYTGVPTLAHARTTQREISVDVLGLTVPVRLEAQSFSFDFGDGTGPLVTSDPGGPYPDTTNQHTYMAAAKSVVITLRTTWTATARHPGTGETIRLDEPLYSEELSNPFEVRKPVVVLTDEAEERLGH